MSKYPLKSLRKYLRKQERRAAKQAVANIVDRILDANRDGEIDDVTANRLLHFVDPGHFDEVLLPRQESAAVYAALELEGENLGDLRL